MPTDEALRPLYDYATGLLRGICRKPFRLGHLTSPPGDVFLRAMLDPSDHDELAYADTYPGLRALLARWGAIHLDGDGEPLRIRFNFYDPRNEGIEFQPAAAQPAPAPPLQVAAGTPKRREKRPGGRRSPR